MGKISFFVGGKNMNKRTDVKKLTFAALFLALAMVLPFLTGQIPQIGSMLCPMHIPALLCGFVCGAPWGLGVGLIAPLLRSLLFGMPALFPQATSMALELATYGLISGLMYRLLKNVKGREYMALIIAMVCGRVVWGFARLFFAGLSGGVFTWQAFLAGAITTAVPGIILQLIIIPPIVLLLEKAGLIKKA